MSFSKENNMKQGRTAPAYGRSPSVPLFASSNSISQFKRKPPTRSLSEKMLQNLTNVADKIIHPKVKSTDYIARYSSMAVAVRNSDLATLGDEDDTESGDNETVTSAKRKNRLEVVTSPIGLFLNLLVTFLYQANQYVVAPTSGKYASQLGMSESMSGAIIGATPMAVILSALVFSAWSNYSFKKPLVTCLFMLVIGNFCYAIALQFQSTTLIFVGRLLTGLGGPRGITRRYIADHVSLQDRTPASSHFITAGAMGLTCGPLIAFLTSTSVTNFSWAIGGQTLLVFSDVTAPGWIMAALYLVSLVLCLVYFDEPLARQYVGSVGGGGAMSPAAYPTANTYIATPNRKRHRASHKSVFSISYLYHCVSDFISDTWHSCVVACHYVYAWLTCRRPYHIIRDNGVGYDDSDQGGEYGGERLGSEYQVVVAAEVGDWHADVKPSASSTGVTSTNTNTTTPAITTTSAKPNTTSALVQPVTIKSSLKTSRQANTTAVPTSYGAIGADANTKPTRPPTTSGSSNNALTIADEDLNIQKSIQQQQEAIFSLQKPPKASHKQSTNPYSPYNTTSPLSSASTVQVVKPQFDSSLGIYHSPIKDKADATAAGTSLIAPPRFPDMVSNTNQPKPGSTSGLHIGSILFSKPSHSTSLLPTEVITSTTGGVEFEPSTSPLFMTELSGSRRGSIEDLIELRARSSSTTSPPIPNAKPLRDSNKANKSVGGGGGSGGLTDVRSSSSIIVPDSTVQMRVLSPNNSASNLISPIQSSDSFNVILPHTSYASIRTTSPDPGVAAGVGAVSSSNNTSSNNTNSTTHVADPAPKNQSFSTAGSRPRGASAVSSASTEYVTPATQLTQSNRPAISTVNTTFTPTTDEELKAGDSNKVNSNNPYPLTLHSLRQMPHTSFLHPDERERRFDKSWSKVSLMSTNSLYSIHTPSGRNFGSDSDNQCTCVWHLISIEVAVVLFIYFINKVGQELVVSSVPTLCSDLFGWTAQIEGLYMALMGALVLPGSLLVGRLADGVSDRDLVQSLSYLSLFSVLLVLNTTWIKYTLSQYVLGSVVLFSLLNTLEGVIMALMSKLISPQLAKGTFNSGLLSTEAGTIGRVVGDMAITVLSTLLGSASSASLPTGASHQNGQSQSVWNLVNALYVPIAIGIVLSIALVNYFSTRLDPESVS